MQKIIKKSLKKLKGFSLIELIVAIGVFSILASGVVYVFVTSYKNFFGVGDKQVMVQFAQEGMEAARSIRDNGWQTIVENADGDPMGVQKTNGVWQFSGVNNTLGDLARVIVISAVERNSTGSIVDSGGTDDPDTKKVTVTVSGSGIADYVLVTYFSNWSAKTWEQSDWSGTGSNEFWASMTTASSSYSNVSTSTVGQVSLSLQAGTDMSWSGWSDIVSDEQARYSTNEDFYNMYLGPDGKSLYLFGNTNYGFIKYDISRAQAGIIRPEWKKSLSENMGSGTVNPNGDYAYLSVRLPSDDDEDGLVKVICVTDLSTLSAIDMDSDCYNLPVPGDIPWAGTWYINSMVVNAAGNRLYSFDNYGWVYVFSISGGGATLTLLNTQLLSTLSSTVNAINQTYLDESGVTTYVYLVSDDNNGEFRKFSVVQETGVFTQTYTYSSPTTDFTDIEFLEVSSGKNRFILGTENTSKEFMIVQDDGDSISEVGSYDVPTSRSYAEVTSDGENMAFLHYYSPGGIYAINITGRAPTNGNMTNTTFIKRYHYYTYNQMLYSTSSHGFFVSDHKANNTVDLHFIGRDFTRATGGTYDYKRAITLGLGSTVSSGPHTNFPVVISETQNYLKSVANGGRVHNTNGYDIIFTSDSAGTTVLDHEIEKYDPSTGELVAWVKIPSLSSDTIIYMFYGNADISSTQEHVDGVWSNGYQLVTHMADTNFGGVGDSVVGSNGWFKNNVGYPAESSGKIGPAQYFDASFGVLQIENNADKNQGASDFTVEFWVKPSSSGTATYSAPVYFGNGDVGLLDGWLFRYYRGTTKKLYFHMGDSNTTNLGGVYTNNALDDDLWTHVAMVVDRDWGYQYYINAATDGSCTDAPCNSTAAYLVGETYSAFLGRDLALATNFKGDLDELRISLATRSQGWITTGYNNMNSPATFYSVGDETSSAVYNASGSIVSSIIDLGSTDKVLNSLNINQNVPNGCSLSVTLEGSNDASFATYTSKVVSDNSANNFTSSTPAILNNFRYVRYRLALTACNDNSQTSTLYSLRLNFR
jgi:prepilin-type N-terminal cleavage/methylation domain-containing protein